jgi:cell fate (sporulation/competence/biofilm development) regulator YlbF (YheA/YmcA/DUF963 family)
MAIMESTSETLDMSAVLLTAYELADMIKYSADTADYLYWKERKENDPEVQRLTAEFNKKRQLFEECERFGHFHPNYHEALDQVKAIEAQLAEIEAYSRFQQAEKQLDELLYSVSELIAHAVSDTIKVPSNDPLAASGGGCSTGGGCSGKCG